MITIEQCYLTRYLASTRDRLRNGEIDLALLVHLLLRNEREPAFQKYRKRIRIVHDEIIHSVILTV